MHPTLKNLLAVLAGIVIGGFVNMGLIMMGSQIIPPPAGVNVVDMESLRASMHLFEPRHFIVPFLAHALGALVGAAIAARFAASHAMKFALGVGIFFMIGSIVNVFMLPAPAWFSVLDLVGAYVPMAWLGGRLASKANE